MEQQVGSSDSALSRIVGQSAMHERQAAFFVFIAIAYGCGGGGGGLHRVGGVVHKRAVDERHRSAVERRDRGDDGALSGGL